MAALAEMGFKHDRMLDLTEEMADENPFAAPRLLQMRGITRFGHVLSSAPPPPTRAAKFARDQDVTIAATFAIIQHANLTERSTHTLLVEAGGAGRTSLEAHAKGSYLGAFFPRRRAPPATAHNHGG